MKEKSVSDFPFSSLFAKIISLLPVMNSESAASATVSVWRDGGKRKSLSHKLFLHWNTEVTKVRWHSGAGGNGPWITEGWSSPRDRMLRVGSVGYKVLLSGSLLFKPNIISAWNFIN